MLVLQIEHGTFTPLAFSIMEVWGGNAVKMPYFYTHIIYINFRLELQNGILWQHHYISFL